MAADKTGSIPVVAGGPKEKVVEREVRHAIVRWFENGIVQYGARRDTIHLPESEAKRLDVHGAFGDSSSDSFPSGTAEGGVTDAQVKWLADHTAEQVIDVVRGDRELLEPVLAAEQSRGAEARQGLMTALNNAITSGAGAGGTTAAGGTPGGV